VPGKLSQRPARANGTRKSEHTNYKEVKQHGAKECDKSHNDHLIGRNQLSSGGQEARANSGRDHELLDRKARLAIGLHLPFPHEALRSFHRKPARTAIREDDESTA
jgi:hypothetical protein